MGVEERWFPSLVVVCTGPLHLSPSFVPSDDLASLAEGFSYGFCISTILVILLHAKVIIIAREISMHCCA